MNNKINSDINNYVFSKNKFSLTKPSNSIENKDIDFCKDYSIKNNKSGFNFFGNNNKCYMYSNHKPTKKIDNKLLQNYSIKKFVKNNKQKYSSQKNQWKLENNYTEVNHYNLHASNLIKNKHVKNLNKCINLCSNNPKCNSVIYFQEPYKCNFYDNINLKKDKNEKYDTYTINYKEKDDKINIKPNNILENKKINHFELKHDNNRYTKCFTNEIYNNYNKLENNYNNICKRELGNEYVFANKHSNLNIQKCEDSKIKILCKPSFSEKFSNYNIKDNINYGTKGIIIFSLIIILLIFSKFIKIKTVYYSYLFILFLLSMVIYCIIYKIFDIKY